MFKNKKGYSLTVLVIVIAVILIITTTAVMSIKNVGKDKEISNFMNDLEEVKQYVIEYYAKNNVLPVIFENGVMTSAEETLIQTIATAEALEQINEEDVGEYYFVDMAKLGKINLKDEERGYIVNEGTLNIYVTKPCEYEGEKYYTLTDYLIGRDVVDVESTPFEINVMGNPITWASEAEILVTIPNVQIGNATGWNFKWMKGSKSASDFNEETSIDKVNYFIYGEVITLTENGIYTIYVENPEKRGMVRKVVVSKIDDIPPTVSIVNDELFIDDAETGVGSIRYKIKETADFKITSGDRKASPEYYTMSDENYNDTQKELLVKYLWDDENIKGESIEKYFEKYEYYTKKYSELNNILVNSSLTSGERKNAELTMEKLNEDYPQFAYNNRMFPNDERNIVIYVEDMAGNATVYSAISRDKLVNIEYSSTDAATLFNSKVVINNNTTYTNSRNVTLFLQSMYAQQVFVTEERGAAAVWEEFKSETRDFILSEGDGEKIVYAFFQDSAGKNVGVYDKIILDVTPPSDDAPTISMNLQAITIECNQTDSVLVDEVETQSGIGTVMYGIREESQTDYTWFSKVDVLTETLTSGRTYYFVTKARDRAGNETTSKETAVYSSMVINNNDEYTNTRNITLSLHALNADSIFITEDSDATPLWKDFDSESVTYQLSTGDGLKKVYAFFGKDGNITGIVHDEIKLDTNKPTNTAPLISDNLNNFYLTSTQADTSNVINGVETASGIIRYEYGIKQSTETNYVWYDTADATLKEIAEGKTFNFATKAIDKAGNEQISLPVSLTLGTSVLVDNIEPGHYVEFNFTKNTYTISDDESGITSAQEITTNENVKWRVLSVNQETGKIMVTSQGFANTDIGLKGIRGYKNGVKILNDICETLYTDTTLGISAKCMTVEDIYEALGETRKNSGYYLFYPSNNEAVSGKVTHNGKEYSKVKATANARFYKSDEGGQQKGPDEYGYYYKTPTSASPIYFTSTWNDFYIPSNKTEIINIITNNSGSSWGWLASTCEYCQSSAGNTDAVAGYGLYALSNSKLGYYALYSSDGVEYESPSGIRPIIILDAEDLKIDINHTSQDGSSSNGWNLTKQ